jgi:hypothetical protein
VFIGSNQVKKISVQIILSRCCMSHKLYIFNESLPDHIAPFKGRLFIITEISEEDSIIDVLMLDDYSEWCFTQHEFIYYCSELN